MNYGATGFDEKGKWFGPDIWDKKESTLQHIPTELEIKLDKATYKIMTLLENLKSSLRDNFKFIEIPYGKIHCIETITGSTYYEYHDPEKRIDLEMRLVPLTYRIFPETIFVSTIIESNKSSRLILNKVREEEDKIYNTFVSVVGKQKLKNLNKIVGIRTNFTIVNTDYVKDNKYLLIEELHITASEKIKETI